MASRPVDFFTVNKLVSSLVILIFFCSKTQSVFGKNEAVVMSLHPASNVTVQPRILLTSYSNERNDKIEMEAENRTSRMLEEANDLNNNNNNNNNNVDVSFPRSLDIIPKILLKVTNEECVRDTMLAMEAMKRHERWTLEMFDSFPKFPVGILTGNHYQLGNFDECINAKQPITESDDPNATPRIQGQYCLPDIYFLDKRDNNSSGSRFTPNIERNFKDRFAYNNSVLHWGICLPSSCNVHDSKIFVEEIFKSIMNDIEILNVSLEQNKCYTDHIKPWNDLEIVYGSIIGVFLLLIIFATVFHLWTLRKRQNYVAYNLDTARDKSTLKEIIVCFSVIRNVRKFLQTKPSDLNLECICGIKFLSMILIICGHTLIFLVGGPLENIEFIKEKSVQVSNSFAFNNTLLVDTFLTISGFLMCRLLLLELDKRKGKLNFLILYISRYIRLTPSYVVVIGLYCSFLPRLGSGPLWNSRIGLEQERCMKSYWTNLLYINNYVNTEYLCMFQSWYLAVDYHLFIIAPFIIYPLWRWSKFGETLLLASVGVGIAIPFWITYRDNLDPTLLAFPPEVTDVSTNAYFVTSYIKTHMRSSSYFIGLFFGYIIHRIQSSGSKIPCYIIWIGNIVAIICSLLSLFSIVIFFYPDHDGTALESAIYASLHRVAWCLSMGWVMVICITDNAAIINKFLSWKFFIPFSRLTYCAYLANGFIEIYHLGTLRQNSYLNLYEMVCRVLAHIVLTLLAAFVLCILFESPIHGLEKILLMRDKIKEQRKNSTLRPIEETS